MARSLVRVAGLVAVLALTSVEASAVCGDTVVDAGEDCDDGNTQGGDCCDASCKFEPTNFDCTHAEQDPCLKALGGTCDGAGKCLPSDRCVNLFEPYNPFYAGFVFHVADNPGEEHDRLRWSMRGGNHRFSMADFHLPGDPTADTSYLFCIYDFDAETFDVPGVRHVIAFEAGDLWRRTRTGWQFRRAAPNAGAAKVRAQLISRMTLRGAEAPLPGPVDGSRYFDSIGFGLINTAGYCAVRFVDVEAAAIQQSSFVNTATRFHHRIRTFRD